ncbi:MAG TPA: hypothetical protein VGC65_00720 [Bacteroidia bacterium]|jgi:hypothetical protein
MKEKNTRRNFISSVLSGAAAFGLASIPTPLKAAALETDLKAQTTEAEKWLAQMKGKHKMVFDMWKHSNGAALSWALTLMDSYNDMGIPDKDLSLVIILRYGGTPLAIADPLWAKYGFGKRIELKDPETSEFSLRNLYAKCKTEDDDCFELFQKRGGLICVCSQAIEHSAISLAESLKLDKETVKKEFFDNVLPGIKLMPSGIWALQRSQELGCKFCSAG